MPHLFFTSVLTLVYEVSVCLMCSLTGRLRTVKSVGDSTLDRLRKLLLDLLGNDRGVTTVLGVGLVGRLVVGVGASGVDLRR